MAPPNILVQQRVAVTEQESNIAEDSERRSSENGVQEITPSHDPGDLSISNFSFNASKAQGVGKCKSLKVKTHKKKVLHVEKPLGFSKPIYEMNIGEKRKWPDPMIINEGISDDLEKKRLKCVGDDEVGSVSQTVEAEVGDDQPRREL